MGSVIVRCQWCGEPRRIDGITTDQLRDWSAGKLIQEVMPHISPDDRELLISRTCETCFKWMSAAEEDTHDETA